MNNKPMSMVAEVVDVAEHSTYLELTSRICYYDAPNLNGDMLPYDETTLTRAQTLVNMPVQARYRVNAKNQDDLGGHELIRRKDGSVEFRTQSIGTHTSVEIHNDNVILNDGEIKELPCLFATYRIWKRYPKYIAAVKRLYENNMLYGSWEINTYKYEYDNGIRKITDYEFFANTLLGESNPPSYGPNATALSMAALDNKELMVAEAYTALSQDLLENMDKEENSEVTKKNKETVAEETVESTAPVSESEEPVVSEQVEETAEEATGEATVETVAPEAPEASTAQLTERDLWTKVSEECNKKLKKRCYVAFMFPNEKEVWCAYEGAESELDYVKFTYEVGGDDTISVSDPEYVKLSVSVAEVNAKISELEQENEIIKAELELKNAAITNASETIQALNIQISELTPYKEQVEAAEQARIEAEIAEEKERLKAKMLKGNLFSEEEIAEKAIADLIEARNESAINSLIADKFVASFNDTKNEASETAEVKQPETATASLEVDDEDTDVRSFMSKILFN